MGGRIEVQSEPERGSTFAIHLPAADRATRPRSKAPVSAAPAAAARQISILIVDDDAMLLRSLARTLRAQRVRTCAGADEALDLLRDGERFDLILCDVMMPGTDGIDLFHALEASSPKVAAEVVFMTGGAFTARAEQFVSSASNVCLQKPIAPADLERLVLRRANRPPS